MSKDDRAGDGVFICVSRQSGKGGFNFVVTHSGGGLERVLSLFWSHKLPRITNDIERCCYCVPDEIYPEPGTV